MEQIAVEENSSQLSLFHSFPRGPDPENRAGLAIVESIADIGFVLVPEILTFKGEPTHDGTPREMRVGQKRICFTQIDAGEIKKHAKAFGKFSIEFDLLGLAAIGATPVFYLPPASTMSGMGGLAESLIVSILGDSGNLVKEMADIKNAMFGRSGDEFCTLSWKEFQVPIPVHFVSAFVAYLEWKHGEAQFLHNQMRGIGQLFCPTHNLKYGPEMAYYHQREWRIVGDIAFQGNPTMRDLNSSEKKSLLRCNEAFFSRKIELLDGVHRRVDQCRIYLPPNDVHPMTFAKRVIAPSSCVKRVSEIMKSHRYDIEVVVLED